MLVFSHLQYTVIYSLLNGIVLLLENRIASIYDFLLGVMVGGGLQISSPKTKLVMNVSSEPIISRGQ